MGWPKEWTGVTSTDYDHVKQRKGIVLSVLARLSCTQFSVWAEHLLGSLVKIAICCTQREF